MRTVFCKLALALSLTWTSTTVASSAKGAKEARYTALIIANNQSIDAGLPSLSYADDDGAKYYELFASMGARVEFLSVLDRAAQKQFPEATAASTAPTLKNLEAALERSFAGMEADAAEGYETTFYFVFTGHGSVAKDREGYLHLFDAKLLRRDLYAKVLRPSTANWNHLIIDACNAYFVVEKRGESEAVAAVRRFLRSEDLRNYPNTGVILAASSESKTHEWSRWRAGVFSHELRSGLLGAADVDGNGAITYAEAAYAVEAANATILDPRARLRVYARPPALRIEAPLISLDRVQAPKLGFDTSTVGHHFVVDARGIRVLDLHPDGEDPRRIALLGQAPFTLSGPQGQAQLPTDEELSNRSLAYSFENTSSRGEAETGYRAGLFSASFGKKFLEGALAASGQSRDDWDGWYGTPQSALPELNRQLESKSMSGLQVAALSSFSGALVAGGLAGTFYYLSVQSYQGYLVSQSPSAIREARLRTEREQNTAHVLVGVSTAAALAGGTLLLIDALRGPKKSSLTLAPSGSMLMLQGEF